MWGGKHIPLDFIVKGIPELYRNTHQGRKTIEGSLKELRRDELVILLQKNQEKAMSIISHLSKENCGNKTILRTIF